MNFKEWLKLNEMPSGRAAESPVKVGNLSTTANTPAKSSPMCPKGSEDIPAGWKAKSPPGINRPTPLSQKLTVGLMGGGVDLPRVLTGGSFGGGGIGKKQ